ncbi:hypothetical protein RRG08_037694 [Elysia crispata]|uniref:Uncharacterized protein n=1 Tax=Elysia crispata TaxID=231223 RepID=A0AAE1A8Q8_9GAST|nr:hypothetical protein RRG08_037694 [Elysia crispata]
MLISCLYMSLCLRSTGAPESGKSLFEGVIATFTVKLSLGLKLQSRRSLTDFVLKANTEWSGSRTGHILHVPRLVNKVIHDNLILSP